MDEQSRNLKSEEKTRHYDLSEEASKRTEGGGATEVSRKLENDDLNEETGRGPVDGPHDSGLFGQNKLPTTLDEES